MFLALSTGRYDSSRDSKNLDRIRALLFFHQFKEELLAKIPQRLKDDLDACKQTAELVKTVFEPFVPYLVADQLSG